MRRTNIEQLINLYIPNCMINFNKQSNNQTQSKTYAPALTTVTKAAKRFFAAVKNSEIRKNKYFRIPEALSFSCV